MANGYFKPDLALIEVIMGGSRKRPKAAISLLYPYISEPDNMGFMSMPKVGGLISEPYFENMSFGSQILAGGSVNSVIVVYDSTEFDTEQLMFSSAILAGGEVVSTAIDIDTTQHDTEQLLMASVILAGGEVKVIRVDYDSTVYDTEELTFSSAILPGGSVGV